MRPRRFLLYPTLAAVLALTASCTSTAQKPASPQPTATVAPPSWKGAQIKTDVLVIGGTPSGVAAALAAARRGAKVLLIEPRDALGGDIVYAMLNMFDVPMRPDGTSPAATGIFGEFFKPLGIGFDVSKARALFEAKVAAEPNITLWKRAKVAEVWREGNRVTSALIKNAPGTPNPAISSLGVGVSAKVVIDATNDADVAARAGAKVFVGRQAGGFDSKQQSVSLLFSVSGADWQRMTTYVTSVQTMPAAKRIGQEYASDVAPTTSKEVAAKVTNVTPQKPIKHRMGGVDGNYIWERGDVIAHYVPRNPNVIALPDVVAIDASHAVFDGLLRRDVGD
ncbi:FAD-dependent oxidoreductase, partial [bacterium]